MSTTVTLTSIKVLEIILRPSDGTSNITVAYQVLNATGGVVVAKTFTLKRADLTSTGPASYDDLIAKVGVYLTAKEI